MPFTRSMIASATFAETYIRAGLVPGQGGAYFLPRIVGTAKALEMFWTSETINAQEALSLGIVNHVYDDATFREDVLALAGRIARSSPVHVQLTKRAVYAAATSTLTDALELAASVAPMAQTADQQPHGAEGIPSAYGQRGAVGLSQVQYGAGAGGLVDDAPDPAIACHVVIDQNQTSNRADVGGSAAQRDLKSAATRARRRWRTRPGYSLVADSD